MERVIFEGAVSIKGVDLAAADLLAQLYAARLFRPVWKTRAEIEQLYPLAARATAEGLDRADYPFDVLEALLPEEGLPVDEIAQADLDIVATETFVRIAYQLRFGKLNPNRFLADWNFERTMVMSESAAEVVQALLDASIMSRVAFRPALCRPTE